MWGLLWLYDFVLTLRKPNLYTGKYLMYYCVAAYFTSFSFSIVAYFQDENNFTSVSVGLLILVGYQFDVFRDR